MFDSIVNADSFDIMRMLRPESFDLVFLDPPYNLQLRGTIERADGSMYAGVTDDWDKFESLADYDRYCLELLDLTRFVLKKSGSLWVCGMYHNILRIGKLMQDKKFWILNMITWNKPDATPNFKGTRFQSSAEYLLWARPYKDKRCTFNYQVMKRVRGRQMNSLWDDIGVCRSPERLRVNGVVHPTQKPEALLERIIMATTNVGDVILDPYFGTGTTGVVAKHMRRHWLGIETDPFWASIAKRRIDGTYVPLC